MKYVITILMCSLFLFSTNGYADPTRQEFDSALRQYNTPAKTELPQCPPPIVVKQESVLPDWVWFALGGLTGIAGVSFFYYNRQGK